MGRPRDEQKLDRIYDYIKQNPGLRPGTIAKKLGYSKKDIERALPQLEGRGNLLWEEEDAGLYKFNRKI